MSLDGKKAHATNVLMHRIMIGILAVASHTCCAGRPCHAVREVISTAQDAEDCIAAPGGTRGD